MFAARRLAIITEHVCLLDQINSNVFVLQPGLDHNVQTMLHHVYLILVLTVEYAMNLSQEHLHVIVLAVILEVDAKHKQTYAKFKEIHV